MTAKYWIKLYHEVLDDPKMGMLPDNVYRRCVEIFLLAGRLDDGGNLPCTNELCWMLRQRPETFEPELKHLESVGILTKTETGWIVTNFEKRQAAITDAGRMKEYRKRLKKAGQTVTNPLQSGYATVTKRNTDTDTDTDITTTTIGSKNEKNLLDQIGELCKANFADPTEEPFKSSLIRAITEHGNMDVLEAIQIALSPERQNGKPKNWGYVLGILKNRTGTAKPKYNVNGENKNGKHPRHNGAIHADIRGTGIELEQRGVFDPNDPNDPGAVGARELP